MQRVRDNMSSDFQTVLDKAPLLEVYQKMLDDELDFLVVVDSTNRYFGVITSIDLIKLHDRQNVIEGGGCVRDVIVPTITINPGAFMVEAVGIVENFPNIDQIIVIDQHSPIGVLRKRDLLHWAYLQVKPNGSD